MKHIRFAALAALAVLGMTACQDDTDPKISTATEFELNTPPMVNETLVLSPEGTYTFTVSQPNYGLTLAPTYGIEVSLKEDFTPVKEGTYVNSLGEEVAIPGSVVIPLESQIHAVLNVKQSNLATAICAMRGIGTADDYTDEDPRPLYVRATAAVANQPSTAITSNVVELKSVKGYCAIESGTTDVDVLYNPGNANGWDFSKSMLLAATSDNVYEGYLAIDGEFKFTHQAEWSNPGNYGAGEFTENAETGVWEGELIENGGNFNGPASGLYYTIVTITNPATAADEVAGSVKMIPITSVGLIGDFNGWDLGTIVEMTPMDGFSTWKAEGVDLGDGGWKFTMNHSWDYNLGGYDNSDNMLNLVQNGGNLTGAGTRTVILDLSKLPYSARYE